MLAVVLCVPQSRYNMKICFSSGEYDDHQIHMYCEVPSLEWVKLKLQQWVDEHPKVWDRYNFSVALFLDWLLTHDECVFVKLDFEVCFLGSYDFSDMDKSVRPTKNLEIDDHT